MAIVLHLESEMEARLLAKAAAQGVSAEEFLKIAIENLLVSEKPKVYRVGTALVVKSIPIGALETVVEQGREERLQEFI